MNPLASTKCAGRLLMALTAITSILLMAACGSNGGTIPPLGGGYTKASLTGQYVIAQTGTAFNSQGTALQPFSETIVFTADGKGNLNITADDGDQGGATFALTSAVSGLYSISSDGTGALQINYSSTSQANYAITMIDDSHFYVIEQDTGATSSGLGEIQNKAAFTAPPSGSFVFKAHNINTSSRVGGIAIAGGAITGNEDFLTYGSLSPGTQPIASTISMSTPDSNGRGTFTLSDGTSFNYYVVSSSKFHFVSNIGSLEIGQAETQTAPAGGFSVATLAAGTSYVFGSSGDTSNVAGIHSAGVFTTDGNGHIEAGNSTTTPGAVDYVQDFIVNPNLPFTVSGGIYTLATNGRGQISLTLSGGAISPQIFWMVNGTYAYFLANNTAAVEDGTFSLQQGGPFTTLSNQAAFVMDGVDTSFKDRVGGFQPTSGGFNWNQAANAFDPTLGVFTPTITGTNGTYTVSANGRVAAVVNGVTLNGVTPGVVFYLSSPSTGFMVQEDSADIGGAFAQQASQ
jgi:hypothetical protein